MTRFKFGSRKELWHEEATYKYIPAPAFGRIMSYKRFDILRKYICFTSRSREDPKSCSAENRWSLCEEFMNSINEHRQERVISSDLLCVDESMSRWYGRRGEWIPVGLPHYVAMDRKPEAGCEIQDVACGRSGIMIGLRFVKSAQDRTTNGAHGDKNHGTQVLLHVSAPWSGSGRIICADSYFASVEAASLVYDNGLRFTRVVKNSTKKFPMEYLGGTEMNSRGDHISMTTKCRNEGNVEYNIIALCWVDRNRRCFVSTAGSTLPGDPQERMRIRDLEAGSGASNVFVEVPIPSLVQTYYSAASRIDSHNRCRQDDLDLEKTVAVREWSFRVNCTLLSVCVVENWLLYKGGRLGRDNMRPYDYYATLAHELIDNSFDTVGLRNKNASTGDSVSSLKRLLPTSGAYEHLTPTKKLRKTIQGRTTTFRLQRRCGTCVCSSCQSSKANRTFYCHSSTSGNCFAVHLREGRQLD